MTKCNSFQFYLPQTKEYTIVKATMFAHFQQFQQLCNGNSSVSQNDTHGTYKLQLRRLTLFNNLLTKVRHLVSRLRKSGMTMQQLQVRKNCFHLQYAKRWKFGIALHNGTEVINDFINTTCKITKMSVSQYTIII